MARTYPHCLCASTWNTSIDSIVPLPVDLDSLPPAPYASAHASWPYTQIPVVFIGLPSRVVDQL